MPRKRGWINKIRLLRKTLKLMKEKKQITQADFKLLYRRAKGGFFRNRAHMIFYINQNNMFAGAKK